MKVNHAVGFSFISLRTMPTHFGIAFLTFGVQASLKLLTSETSMAKITISFGSDNPSLLPSSRAEAKLTLWVEAV